MSALPGNFCPLCQRQEQQSSEHFLHQCCQLIVMSRKKKNAKNNILAQNQKVCKHTHFRKKKLCWHLCCAFPIIASALIQKPWLGTELNPTATINLCFDFIISVFLSLVICSIGNTKFCVLCNCKSVCWLWKRKIACPSVRPHEQQTSFNYKVIIKPICKLSMHVSISRQKNNTKIDHRDVEDGPRASQGQGARV